MSLKLRSYLPYGNVDSLLAALAGYLLIQASARHGGIGVSPDSVVYMSTAASIHDHGLINDFSGFPMMDFPAFYPVFLSGIIFLTGHGVLSFGPVLNGLLFAMLIFLCGWLMEKFTVRLKGYKWILLSCIVLSPCLLEVYSMIWSETLFLLLSLLFILCARRYFLSHTMGSLVLLGFIAALACVTRYAGISFILTGGLLILCDLTLRWGRKILHLFLFGLVGITLLVLNMYRNHLVTGTLTGYREKAITSFGTNLKDFGGVLCDWLPFVDDDYRLAAVVGVCSILFCMGLFVYRLVRRRNFFSYENIALAFFLGYAMFILATASLSRFQQLDSRLLSPLFIPWLWGSSSWIADLIQRSRDSKWGDFRMPVMQDQQWKTGLPDEAGPLRGAGRRGGHRRPVMQGLQRETGGTGEGWPRVGRPGLFSWFGRNRRLLLILAGLAAAVCFQAGQWAVNAFNWEGVKSAGIPGYTEDPWQKSETIQYIRTHKDLFSPHTPTYSNAFEGIWFFTGIQSDMLPHRDLPWDVAEFLKEDHLYVIWFNDAVNTDLVTIEFISGYKKMVSRQRFDDGTIYFFTTDPSTAKPK